MENTVDIMSRKEAAKLLGICLTTLDRLDITRTRVRHRVMFKRDVLKNRNGGKYEPI